jgi:hypothetical protein
MAAEGICFYGFSRLVVKFVVILLEFNLPCHTAGFNFIGFTLVSEVLVVGPNEFRY